MAALAIVAVPLLIMFFALGMERVEARLRYGTVGENDVEEFLEQARPNEVRELFRHGIGRALELFKRRRRTPPHRTPLAITAGPPSTNGAVRHDVDLSTVTTMPIPVRADTVPTPRPRAS